MRTHARTHARTHTHISVAQRREERREGPAAAAGVQANDGVGRRHAHAEGRRAARLRAPCRPQQMAPPRRWQTSERELLREVANDGCRGGGDADRADSG